MKTVLRSRFARRFDSVVSYRSGAGAFRGNGRVERVFAIPVLGNIFIQSILTRDSLSSASSLFFICYGFTCWLIFIRILDPRIRSSKGYGTVLGRKMNLSHRAKKFRAAEVYKMRVGILPEASVGIHNGENSRLLSAANTPPSKRLNKIFKSTRRNAIVSFKTVH